MKSILLRNVPADLHRDVKVAAAQADVSMQALILECMKTAEKTAEILKRTEPYTGS